MLLNIVQKILKRRNKTIVKKEEEYYYTIYNGFKIYSKSFKTFKKNGLFDKIFKDEIYNFKNTSESPRIIDCGANIGLATLYWKYKYPEAFIICFEPSKEVFQILEKNIEVNNIKKVELHNVALSSIEGELDFTTNENLSGSLFLGKDLEKKYKVKSTLLSNFINEKVDMLKIDIEGAEIEVLQNIESKLIHVENLFLEYHSFIQKNQQLSYVFSLLENNKFRYFLDGEYRLKTPLINQKVNLSQDLQIGIWAKK